jgi:hypothetical protein
MVLPNLRLAIFAAPPTVFPAMVGEMHLPAYGPDLNPDEMLNQDVKTNAVGRPRPRTLGAMKVKLRACLDRRKTEPEMVKRYFQAKQARCNLLATRVIHPGGGRQRLAELTAPFRVDLCAYDPYLPAAVAERFGARLVGLDELLADREVIVLCAANTAESRHLVTRAHLAAMRPGTVLVNVGRASLVDMAALLDRLRQGDIAAALDVFDEEPLQPDSPLRALPNAYLTPHRAGGILASVQDILAMLADDLERHLQGQALRFPLTENDLHCLG